MYNIEIKDVKDNSVIVERSKVLYNTDNIVTLQEWIKPHARNTEDYPNISSALTVKEYSSPKKVPKGFIGTINNHSNNLQQQNVVYITNACVGQNGHKAIMSDNFHKIVSCFSARKLIKEDWDNQNIEFLAPDETNENFAEYTYDSLVYCLFNNSSQQTSLREVRYFNKVWKIENSFFWMPKETIKTLADRNSNLSCFNDVKRDSDRFVFKLIDMIEKNEELNFSKEAQATLDLARELVIDSFPYRQDFNKVSPEYQINNWDCGWYQIKGLLNWIVENNKDEDIKEKYNELKEAYAELGDKMRPMVYELGFLKK